ncbi:hypothetical protein ABIB25_000147 [Nakamurella sp. UYEF19]
MRGAAAMKLGRISDKVVEDAIDTSVDRCGETDLVLRGEQQLPEDMRQRQPEELQVVGADDALGRDCDAEVQPAAMGQLHTLRPSGGARGVDDGGEMVGLDRGHGSVDGLRVFSEMVSAQFGETVHGQDVLAVGGAIEEDDEPQIPDETIGRTHFRQLGLVLGEADDGAAVDQDVRDVLGVGAGVDRRGCGPGNSDGEVSKHPVESRGRGDGNSLLGPHAQCEQSGGQLTGPALALRPRDGEPSGGSRGAESLAHGRAPAPVEESGANGTELRGHQRPPGRPLVTVQFFTRCRR